MKNSILIFLALILVHTNSNAQVEIETQQLRLNNLGDTDSNFGILWGENVADVFGLVYDGVGSEGNNVLHLREYIGSSSNIMSIKADGRVGIGTQDPLFKTVIKNISNAITNDSIVVANLALMLEKGSNNDNEGIGLGFQSSSTRSTVGAAITFERSGGSSTGHLHFATKSSSVPDDNLPIRMTLTDVGKLGVGTTDPQARIHVGGVGNGSNVLFENGGDLQWKNSTGSIYNVLTLNTDDNVHLDGDEDILFRTRDPSVTERMRITKDGSVGIGESSPEAPLHINDFMKLEPRTTALSCLSTVDEGRIYYDANSNKFRGCVAFSTGQVSHGWVDFH